MTTSDAKYILAGLAILAIGIWSNWQQYGPIAGCMTARSKIVR